MQSIQPNNNNLLTFLFFYNILIKPIIKEVPKIKTKAEEMYDKMNPWRLFFIIALPGMVSMFAMSVYSIFEGAFIGHRLGEGAFAAVNIAMPLVMINFSLADLVGVGSSAPISIALGKEDRKTANNIFSCAVVMIFLTSVIMGSIMFFAATPIAKMMGADDILLETSVKYLRTFALCSPFCTIFFAMDNYLRICGYVKTSMFINIFCNILTIGLLTLFLLVFEMDVVGSAIATCISMCVCSVLAIIPFLANNTLLEFAKPNFSKALIKEVAVCGSPVFLSNVSGRISSIAINISLMTVGAKVLGENGGTTAVAVYAILMYASDFCWPLLYGIADSLSPAIGYNWGAENYKRVKKIAKCGFIGTAFIGLVSTSILFFFPDAIASLFANAEDTQLLEISTKAIRLFCFAYLFRWVGVSAQSFFTAIEKPVFATIMSVSIAFAFPLLFLVILWPLNLDGIWLNFVGVNLLAAILGVILLIKVIREIKVRELMKKMK